MNSGLPTYSGDALKLNFNHVSRVFDEMRLVVAEPEREPCDFVLFDHPKFLCEGCFIRGHSESKKMGFTVAQGKYRLFRQSGLTQQEEKIFRTSGRYLENACSGGPGALFLSSNMWKVHFSKVAFEVATRVVAQVAASSISHHLQSLSVPDLEQHVCSQRPQQAASEQFELPIQFIKPHE